MTVPRATLWQAAAAVQRHLADAALILVGGMFLMMPGYLTDVVGFLFLFRWTRPFARKMIAFFIARQQRGGPIPRRWTGPGDSFTQPTKPLKPADGAPKRAGDPTIIPGEVVEPGQEEESGGSVRERR